MEHREHFTPDELDRWLEGELATDRVKHLMTCRACALEAHEVRALVRGLEQLPHFAPSPGFADRVMVNVRTPTVAPVPAQQPGRRFRLRPAWAVAATLAGLSLVSTVVAVAWGLQHQAQVVMFGQWVLAMTQSWGAAAVVGIQTQLARLPVNDIVQPVAQHAVRVWAFGALGFVAYLATCTWMRRLMITPRRAYATTR